MKEESTRETARSVRRFSNPSIAWKTRCRQASRRASSRAGGWCLIAALVLLSGGPARGECSFSNLAKPYKSLRYNNLNGYVYANGKVRRVPYGLKGTKYNAIGCSGFVVPMLNRAIHHNKWRNHQRKNWRLYQKYGSDIAEAFDLPFVMKLRPSQARNRAAIRKLIAARKLVAGQIYLFDIRLKRAGHTGFIEVKKNGTLKSYMFSGIRKGTDKSDDTLYKSGGENPQTKPAPRSKRRGYSEGSFASWQKASQYRDSKVFLFRLPAVVPDVLTGEAGVVGASLGSLSGCGITSQLTLGSKVTVRMEYNCRTGKATAIVTGTVDAYSAINGSSSYSYPWRGTMKRKGNVFTGVLYRQDNSARPTLRLTVRCNDDGTFHASAVVPFTYVQFKLDGTCSTPVTTFPYHLTRVSLKEP